MAETPTPNLTPEQKEDIERHKDVAAIAYLWIFSVVVLYRYRHSSFVQHHARQGMWLFFISIPVWLIPYGHYLEFFVLAAMIIGFLNAAQGQYHDLPVIGALARGSLTLYDLWKMLLKGIVRFANTVKRGVMGPSQPDKSVLADERPSGRAEEGKSTSQEAAPQVAQREGESAKL